MIPRFIPAPCRRFLTRLRYETVPSLRKGLRFRWGTSAPSMEHLEHIRRDELDRSVGFFPPGARVLEIGAGAGWQASILRDMGFAVEAIDLPTSRYTGMQVFPVTPYDGTTIPFADHSFDVVFSSNVLEHVPHVSAFQTEIHRVLAPGGIAVHLLPTAAWRVWTHLTHLLGCRSWSGRHGERGNQFTEAWYFSRFFWTPFFKRHGWRVERHTGNRLFYTGVGLLDHRLSLRTRAWLHWILGSACHLYVLRPRAGTRV